VTEIIFAVLFVSLMGLTRCYKTTVFFTFIHLHNSCCWRRRWWIPPMLRLNINV